MALETSGFQLSQFERAPQIPGNIGVVDTKSIYGSVVDALKANEALRTTQAVQAATDAELALARQKAQAEAGLLEPESEARRAKAQLFTAGAPLEMELLAPRAAAERAKLGYETALSGELAKPENVSAAARAKTLSSTARGTYELALMAADPRLPKEVREAAAIKAQTIQSANQRFKAALDAGKVDFHTANEDGTRYVRFKDGSSATIGYPETYTGNAAAYLTGPITGGLGAPAAAGGVTPLVPAGAEEIPVGAFAPAAPTGIPTTAPGAVLSGVAPRAGVVRGPTKSGLLAAQSAVKFGGETSPLAGIEGDEVKKEALSTAAEMGKEARKEIRTQLTNLNAFEAEARKEDDIQRELDALIKDANEKGIMISGGSFFGRGLRALAPGEAAAFQSRLGSIVQHIQLGNMLRLKNASSTGATGFGSLTENENKLLQSDYGVLTNPDLPSESLVAALERAKRGMNLRREEALNTIRGRLAVERGVEQQSSSFFQNAKDRFIIPRHPLEVQQQQAAPAGSGLPSLEGMDLFPSRGTVAPARLTLRPEPTPEPAAGPHTEGPLTPDETESTDISEDYEQLPAGTSGVSSYPGRMVTPPAAAPAPAAPAPAAPAPAAAPARDANAPASPLLMDFIKRLGEVNPEVAQRRREMAAQTGGTSYAAAGPFAKPIEPAIPESNVRPVGQSTWEAYNERRRRATEAGLPQVALSPQGVAIARELRSQYEAGQRAKQGEQPVVEIMGSDGKRRAFAVEDPTIADALIGILNGQQAPNLEPRLETDREATRQLTEGRMRREELARQFRAMPRR